MYAIIKKLTAEESANVYGHKYVVEKYYMPGCRPSYYYFMRLDDAKKHADAINNKPAFGHNRKEDEKLQRHRKAG